MENAGRCLSGRLARHDETLFFLGLIVPAAHTAGFIFGAITLYAPLYCPNSSIPGGISSGLMTWTSCVCSAPLPDRNLNHHRRGLAHNEPITSHEPSHRHGPGIIARVGKASIDAAASCLGHQRRHRALSGALVFL